MEVLNMAPVVVFVYDRLEHAKQSLCALDKNQYVEQTTLYICSDLYLEDEKNKEKVLAVRDYIEKFARESHFKKVIIRLADQHRGLANTVISRVTEIISQYGKVIVVEDDLVTTKGFLRYMNEALDYYKDNDKVWSISGYSLPLYCFKKNRSDVYAGYRGSSWGWATWRDRWDKTDWNVSDYSEFICSKKRQKQFNKGGEDMTALLTKQMRGESDSWAIRWNYQQYREGMFSIFPVKSQVRNLGCDGSGQNCERSILKLYDTEIMEFDENIRFEDCQIDERIARKSRRAYSRSLIQRIIFVIEKKICYRLY